MGCTSQSNMDCRGPESVAALDRWIFLTLFVLFLFSLLLSFLFLPNPLFSLSFFLFISLFRYGLVSVSEKSWVKLNYYSRHIQFPLICWSDCADKAVSYVSTLSKQAQAHSVNSMRLLNQSQLDLLKFVVTLSLLINVDLFLTFEHFLSLVNSGNVY